ncbi:MAG: hypothetical protein ACTH34_13245, partial [Microbacterium gubbeenense]
LRGTVLDCGVQLLGSTPLLRQYLPKSTDLSIVTRAELTAIQDSLNGRPRKTLGYLTPSEKFTELIATTG